MARNEADHEDLMREAVSLIQRIECRYPTRDEPAVAGFNRLGWLFIYLGDDLMYRFDEYGRLRRAFVDGTLYRTTGQTLSALVRRRSLESNVAIANTESTLLRRDLSLDELVEFRDRMVKELAEFSEGLYIGEITRQYPIDLFGLKDQIQQGLRRVLESKEFLAPAIVGR